MLPHCVKFNCKCSNLLRTTPKFRTFLKNNRSLKGAEDFGANYCELFQDWKKQQPKFKYNIKLSKKNSMWS